VPWSIVIVIVGLTILATVFRIGNWTSRLGKRVSKIENLAKAIQEELGEIRNDIKKILERLPSPPMLQEENPVQLTDFGKEVSKTGSAKTWVRENIQDLENSVKDKEEFEIYDMCGDHVQRFFKDDDEFRRIVKATAYKHGADPADVLKVYQIEMRNLLLSKIRQ